jgi:hypothetical protein
MVVREATDQEIIDMPESRGFLPGFMFVAKNEGVTLGEVCLTIVDNKTCCHDFWVSKDAPVTTAARLLQKVRELKRNTDIPDIYFHVDHKDSTPMLRAIQNSHCEVVYTILRLKN